MDGCEFYFSIGVSVYPKNHYLSPRKLITQFYGKNNLETGYHALPAAGGDGKLWY